MYLPIPLTLSYGREVVRGVRDYATTHRSWQIVVADVSEHGARGIAQRARDMPEEVAGLLGFLSLPALRAIFDAVDVPRVNVSAAYQHPGLPTVLPDNRRVGRLAGEYLLAQGFRRFCYVGYPQHDYSRARAAGLRLALEDAGLEDALIEAEGWDQSPSWYLSLPRPIAIMTANDGLAVRVLATLREAGLAVPDDVALIGVDNDDLQCELADPTLSSVDPNARGVGYAAAEMLDRLMDGEAPPAPADQAPARQPPRCGAPCVV